MSTKQSAHLIALRGDETYARYLDGLLNLVRAQGVQVETRHQLAEYALAALGLQFNLRAPVRARPKGTNRYGEPKRHPD